MEESSENKKDREAIAFLEKLVDANQKDVLAETLSYRDVNTVHGILDRSEKIRNYVMTHNLLNAVARLRTKRLPLGSDYKDYIAIGNPITQRKCNAPSCNGEPTGYCSKCQHAVYCGESCQLKDAKRHAQIECEAYQDTMC